MLEHPACLLLENGVFKAHFRVLINFDRKRFLQKLAILLSILIFHSNTSGQGNIRAQGMAIGEFNSLVKMKTGFLFQSGAPVTAVRFTAVSGGGGCGGCGSSTGKIVAGIKPV